MTLTLAPGVDPASRPDGWIIAVDGTATHLRFGPDVLRDVQQAVGGYVEQAARIEHVAHPLKPPHALHLDVLVGEEAGGEYVNQPLSILLAPIFGYTAWRGPGVVTASDDEGETCALRLTLAEVEAAFQPRDAIARPARVEAEADTPELRRMFHLDTA